MQTFIDRLTEQLAQTYPEKISELCIVFPNRRAGLFFKTALARQAIKPFWSPEVFSIEDFIVKLSQVELLDPIAQLFELYRVYTEIEKEEAESFEEFSKWGQILLADFNEIDSYLVDAKSLFSNLRNLKDVENWSLGADDLTPFQREYVNFWESLGIYYEVYSENLAKSNQSWQGLAYRLASENVKEKTGSHHWHKIIFAGFNALNAAEEKIIKELVRIGIAECFWDSDSYYLDSKIQESGRFLRKHRASNLYSNHSNNEFNWVGNNLCTDRKEITITGVSKNIGQAKLAGQIIGEIAKAYPGADLTQTAIVLADENLLFPVLHSLPGELGPVNVTMGYPLKNTPLAGFIELIFQLHDNGISVEKNMFYSEDILQLLYHPYTKLLLDKGKKSLSQDLINYLRQNNILFCTLSTLLSSFNCPDKLPQEQLGIFLAKWENVDSVFVCLSAVLKDLEHILREQWKRNHDEKSKLTNIELEYLFAFSKIVNRVQSLANNYPYIDTIKTFHGLLDQLLRTTNLSFYGEPVSGLQVMGMLETRALDFENIILLSANEGVLPSGKNQHSFIPQDVKRIYGMPTQSEKDSIFAYHFYRLLQKAQNIQIMYNTETGNLGGAEKSRFLTQLLYEFPTLNTRSTIKNQVLEATIEPHADETIICINKTKNLLAVIRKKGEKGFSPSLLNIYRNCSLKFYFHLIADLRESDTVEETIGADTFGNVIHQTLESLYQPYLQVPLTLENLDAMKGIAEATLIRKFENYYSAGDLLIGKNLLTVKVAAKFLLTYLDKEKAAIQLLKEQGQHLVIRQLEQEFETMVAFDNVLIKTKGIIDRIETVDGLTRIIDYKTGKTEDQELMVRDMETLEHDPSLNKSFQLLMYAWLYTKNGKISGPVQAGIISFRQLSTGLKTVKINKDDILSSNLLKDFEAVLMSILREIVNPDLPFNKTPDKNTCEYCSFRTICNR